MNFKVLTLAAVAALAPRLAADTEWLVTPQYSDSGRIMLHANRESTPQKSSPVWMRWDAPGKGTYGFLRIGDKTGYCFAGINEKGLAAAYTTGDPSDDRKPPRDKSNWSGHAAVVISLRLSSTADQARKRIHKAFKDKLISESMVIFLADPRKAVVIECSPQHYASWDLKDSYCVYSHMWKLPGMDDGSIRSTGSAEICSLREWGVREGLRCRREANNGRISVADSIAVSRLNAHDISAPEYEKQRGKSPVPYAPYNKRAQDSYLFELDAEYPDFLSRVYIAFGPPRHTVYLPVALPTLKTLPQEILEPEYFQLAATRHEAAAPEAPVNAALPEFEKKLHREFEEKCDEARMMLNAGKRDEAEKILNDLARKQAAEALAFLRDLK
jgi:hypothetical protein